MNTKIGFTVENKIFTIDLRRTTDWRERDKKCRAYVWGPGDDRSPVKEFTALANHIGAPSVFTVTGEWPVLDKAFKKMNREIVAAKRAVLNAGLRELTNSVDFLPGNLKISFSRKAGCSCGCSPGFIIDGLPRGSTVYVAAEKA